MALWYLACQLCQQNQMRSPFSLLAPTCSHIFAFSTTFHLSLSFRLGCQMFRHQLDRAFTHICYLSNNTHIHKIHPDFFSRFTLIPTFTHRRSSLSRLRLRSGEVSRRVWRSSRSSRRLPFEDLRYDGEYSLRSVSDCCFCIQQWRYLPLHMSPTRVIIFGSANNARSASSATSFGSCAARARSCSTRAMSCCSMRCCCRRRSASIVS